MKVIAFSKRYSPISRHRTAIKMNKTHQFEEAISACRNFKVSPNLDQIVEKYNKNLRKYVKNEIKRKQTFAIMKKEAKAEAQRKLEKKAKSFLKTQVPRL